MAAATTTTLHRDKSNQERRRWPRRPIRKHCVGVIHACCGLPETAAPDGDQPDSHLFVEMLNCSEQGAAFVSDQRYEIGAHIDLLLHDEENGRWTGFTGRVIWCQDHPGPDLYQIGLELTEDQTAPGAACHIQPGSNRAHVGDLDFLTATPLFSSIPRQSLCPLLNCLTSRRLEAGERLIAQGTDGDRLFLVQEGECAVRVESGEETYQVARIKPGEVVGEMAVLTGEPRTAHVDALTPLLVWELASRDFERVAERYPDIRIFLTELITQRFETSPRTADRLIGKFIIKEPLGQGGWSIVYRGVHARLNIPVAIKMMRHDMAMEPEFLTTFRSEAEIIAPMNHPNIVHVYDIDELYRTVFIVMEYLEGRSLEHLLEHRGMLPVSRTIHILTQVLSALDYAHDRGIVHRDVKPANIAIMAEDRVKVLDFGLACPPGTEDMSVAGTVKYAPPEQIEGDPVDGRSDIYSLGIVAYEMVTGERPYPEGDVLTLMDLHCDQDIPDPALLVPDLPEELRRFILTACQRDPDRRYQTAAQALEVLENLSSRLGLDVEQAVLAERHMTSLFVFHHAGQKQDLTDLLEEFSAKAQDMGIVIKLAEFKDI